MEELTFMWIVLGFIFFYVVLLHLAIWLMYLEQNTEAKLKGDLKE